MQQYVISLFLTISLSVSATTEQQKNNVIEVEKKIAELLPSNNVRDLTVRYDNAIEASKLAESINNKHLLLMAKYEQLLPQVVNKKSFLKTYSEVEVLAKELNDFKTLFNAISKKAYFHRENGEYEAQLTTYKDGYALAVQLDYSFGVATMLAGIGANYVNLAQHEKALNYFNDALDFVKSALKTEDTTTDKRSGPKQFYVFLQRQIANSTYQVSDTSKAKKLYLELVESNPDSFLINSDYILFLIDQKSLDEAKLKLNDVQRKIETGLINSKYAIANTYVLNAKLLYELERYSEANAEFNKYFNTEGIFRDQEPELQHRLTFANSLFNANQKEKAADIYKAYTKDIDELHKKQIDEQITYLEATFNVERKEQEAKDATALSESLANQLALERSQSFWQKLSFVTIALAITLLLIFYIVKSRQLNTIAHTDELTKVPNRRFIMEQLATLISRSKQAKSEFSVAIFDIDHFKQVNDSKGHDIGDEVLKKIADLAQTSLRTSDLFGRIGGEEFMVLLSRTEKDQALRILNRLREDIAKYSFEHLGIFTPVTISLGVSQFTGVETMPVLLKKADIALYKAKESGRNKIIEFDFNIKATKAL